MAGDGRVRVEWNRAIVEDVAAECYGRLIMKCCERMEERYELLLPIDQQKEQSYSGLWEILTARVWEILRREKCLRNVQGEWIEPERAVLMNAEGNVELEK